MPIHFDNHIPALQARVVGRTARLHILYDCTVKVARDLHFVARGWANVTEAQSPAAFPVLSAGCRTARGYTHRFQSDWNADGLTITHHLKMDRVTGAFLPDFHLQLSGIRHCLSVQLADDIAQPHATL